MSGNTITQQLITRA